jgi:hypothetical protein
VWPHLGPMDVRGMLRAIRCSALSAHSLYLRSMTFAFQ